MQGVAYQIHGSFAQRASTPDEAKIPVQLLGMSLERLVDGGRRWAVLCAGSDVRVLHAG
jgi:hypothetical protein